MKSYIIALVMLLAIFCTPQERGQAKQIDLETVKAEVVGKDVQLVDVRTPGEYTAGHIDDAINIDVSDRDTFAEKFENLDKEEPVYIYCKMGGRSERAAALLKEMGFKSIFDYSGGYSEWSRQGTEQKE